MSESEAPEDTPGPHGVVVICTKARPREVGEACERVHAASPALPIVVIDASDDDATRAICDRLVTRHAPSMRLRYRRAERPGLARQRNQAAVMCKEMSFPFVHFIDDDTLVAAGYFEAIEARFRHDADIVGIGGVIVNQPAVHYVRLKRMFLLASRRPGTVLPSGRHTLGQYPGTDPEGDVDWLSGCSMSFRTEVFSEFLFDERLHGYSMGEDADFTFRVSRRHRLAVEPGAECIHTVTPTVRATVSARRREGTENTYLRVRRYQEFGLSVAAYWWATLGDMVIRTAHALATRDRASLAEVRGTLQAVRSIATGRCREA